jgi:hypothetical protein
MQEMASKAAFGQDRPFVRFAANGRFEPLSAKCCGLIQWLLWLKREPALRYQ